jgi:hypothetical protein
MLYINIYIYIYIKIYSFFLKNRNIISAYQGKIFDFFLFIYFFFIYFY